jgi:hypothetical protein
MRTATPSPEVYQLHVWVREMSPMIWRRLLVRSDSMIGDLHYTLQMGRGMWDYPVGDRGGGEAAPTHL